MANPRSEPLIDEFERAFTDEVYDGWLGALSPDEFREHVRRLAEVAVQVVEETA